MVNFKSSRKHCKFSLPAFHFLFKKGDRLKRLLHSPLRIILLLSLFLLLSGCVVGRYYEGPQVSPEKIKEIISCFGPPQNCISPTVFNGILRKMDVTRGPLTNYPFANILSYEYNLETSGRLSWLFNFVEPKVKTDHLVIFLDEKDRVKYYGFHGAPWA
jgi:hypothetical protein